MKWITALNLEQWADTIPARTEFPGLVADLKGGAHCPPGALCTLELTVLLGNGAGRGA